MNYIAQSLIIINDRSAVLKWDKVLDVDLAGYNIYMSIGNETNFKRVNPTLVLKQSYITPILRNDQIYFFKISSIDTTGNESVHSASVRVQLTDYVIDPDLQMVEAPHKVAIAAGKLVSVIPFNNFMTLFSWQDKYLTERANIMISKNMTISKTLTSDNFRTSFKLGG